MKDLTPVLLTALTDADKSVVQSYIYDSFGQIISQTGSIENPYTYTSREYDSETGLYYYRARYYDAGIGRFVSEDPIGIDGGINLYLYVKNNPVNWVDPLGLWCVKLWSKVTKTEWLNQFYWVLNDILKFGPPPYAMTCQYFKYERGRQYIDTWYLCCEKGCNGWSCSSYNQKVWKK